MHVDVLCRASSPEDEESETESMREEEQRRQVRGKRPQAEMAQRGPSDTIRCE